MASADMFPNVSFSDVNAAASQEAAGKAVFGPDPASGAARLSLVRPGAEQAFQIDLSDAQIFKLGPMEWLCVSGETEAKAGVEEKLFSRAIKVVLRTEAESKAFSLAFQRWKQQTISGKAGESLENGSIVACKSKFDTKIEASSAQMYFHYYGQLLHQQNMLQDFVRTGTYYAAVMENRADFEGKVVVDVGAGSGILSLFAAQVRSKLLHWFFDSCHFVSDNITGAVCHVNVRLVPNMSMQLRHLKWLNMPNGLFLGTHRLGNESRFVLYQLDSICSFSVFPLTLLKLYTPLF
uniref:type I protein arginine methyltransferase n=1 Tax=Aegilops tauschii subsp. strangulata TaxID=200361 RepID=A0A453AQV6_AEGTS